MQKLKKIFSLLVLTLILTGCGGALSKDAAKNKAEDFINSTLLDEQFRGEITAIEDEGVFYKLNVNIVRLASGEITEVVSYITQDGVNFIPEVGQVMNMEEVAKSAKEEKAKQEQAQKEALSAIPKSAKPKVELFVMSHCPFGTQIEKGALPVIDLLGDKMDFQLKFVHYAMHGEKELNEQLKQFCIQKEEPQKLVAYLKAFLDAGDSEAATAASGINRATINTCVAATDKEFKVTDSFQNKDSWAGANFPPFDPHRADNEKYGVQGSPTLVVNEKLIEGADRSPAGLLKTICSGFENAPAECVTKLSSASPSAGFGFGQIGASTDASCG